jgi:ArsR family transcriptional regulator, arsenate/arsenite/antimonite-responsive transcriptional repressor
MVGTIAPPARDDVAARVALLKAIADPTRLRVLDQLETVGPRCHCELEEALDVPANRMSFHLKVLRDAGLVVAERQGKRVAYRLDAAGVARVRWSLPMAGRSSSGDEEAGA